MKARPEDAPGERPDAADSLSERLNAVLEPPPAAVERVVRGALAGSREAGRRRRRLGAAAAGVAAGAAFLATALLMIVQLRRPPIPPVPAPARSAIEIRNDAGIVTARSPSGRLWIVGAAPRRSVAGSIILVHRGGNR